MTHSTLVIQQQNDVMRVDLYQMHQRRLKYAGAADQRVLKSAGMLDASWVQERDA